MLKRPKESTTLVYLIHLRILQSPKMTCTMSLIPRLVDEPDSSESLCEGGAPASMPFDGRLWRKGKLIVQLKNPDYLSHWKITENDFVGCVYRWCGDDIGGKTSYIPKFELGDSNPDIIVHFNSKTMLFYNNYGSLL